MYNTKIWYKNKIDEQWEMVEPGLIKNIFDLYWWPIYFRRFQYLFYLEHEYI